MDNRTWAERSATSSTAARFEPSAAEVVELTALSRGAPALGRGATSVLALVVAVLVAGIAWPPAARFLGLDQPAPGALPGQDPSAIGAEGAGQHLEPTPAGGAAAEASPGATIPGATARGWEWLPTPVDVPPFGETVTHLWGVADGFVAAVQLRAGDPRSVLLRSADGRDWVDAGLPVAGSLAGSVADGTLTLLLARSDQARPAWELLSTTDGVVWSAPDLVNGLLEGPGTVPFLAGGAFGWIAVVSPSSDGAAAHRLEARFSRDGRRWAAVADPGLEAGLEGRRVVDIAADGRRWVIVAAEPGEVLGTSTAVALVSDDGFAWTEHPIGTITGRPHDLASGVAGFVLVGTEERDGGEHPVSWLSGNGRPWLPYRHRGNHDRVPAGIDLVTATSHGYLAFNRLTGDAWLSTDGGEFVPFPALEPEAVDSIDAIASVGDVLLAGGRELGTPMTWTASLDAMLGRR
jgi:hypothetical protein